MLVLAVERGVVQMKARPLYGGMDAFVLYRMFMWAACADGDGAANFLIKLKMLIRMTVSSAGNCNLEKHSFILPCVVYSYESAQAMGASKCSPRWIIY